VVNAHLVEVDDPTIQQPGFNLPRQIGLYLVPVKVSAEPADRLGDMCPCGETQTMSYIAESCPFTNFSFTLQTMLPLLG